VEQPEVPFHMLCLAGAWAIPHILIVAFQVVCAIHVLRNRREYWWLFAIFFFPLIGSIIYFFYEMYPDIRRGGAAALIPRDAGSHSEKKKPSKRLLRRLEEDLAYTDTIENRKRLADAYLQAGMASESVEAYRPCLQGMYKDDPSILWGFARAVFEDGSCEETIKALDALARTGNKDYDSERELLRARALEEMERIDEALVVYESLAEAFSGEEARCRYGLLLQRSGQEQMALQVFKKTIGRKKRSSGVYRSRQREWFRLAAKQIREIELRQE